MGVECKYVANIENHRAIIKYGKQPNKKGPSNSGYSLLFPNQTESPKWNLGDESDPLVVSTKWIAWRINEEDNNLRVYFSTDGINFNWLDDIQILHKNANFNLWVRADCIVIEDDDNKFGRSTDGESFRFFVITSDGITASNDPSCLINYMGIDN